ncbi:MAG: hypothetical protein HZC41_01230 [Chloroflexi bacterium]|nr:hypothetical protein [Chloroflexota bacterium]
MMVVSDKLLEELQKLNRAQKLRVVQLLVNELAVEEDVNAEKAALLDDLRQSLHEAVTGEKVSVLEIKQLITECFNVTE